VYNQNDQLLSETENGVVTAYTYDANGNMLIQTNLDKDVIYIWDNQNRLIGTITNASDGQHEANYLYDADGIRVVSVIDGIETRYLVDTNRPYAQVLEEYDSNGDILTSYVYGHRLISQERNGDRSFYHPDGLGSIRVLTDETGQVTDTYAYDAYGKLLNVTGDTQNSYLYTGEQYDTITDSYYLRARYYNPEMGRFLSSDPFEGWLTDPLSLTNYPYVHGNPVNATDPSGLVTMMEQQQVNKQIGENAAKTYPALKTTTTVSPEILPAAATQASPTLANIGRASISIGSRIAIDVARATMETIIAVEVARITLQNKFYLPIIIWGSELPDTTKHTFDAITGSDQSGFKDGHGRASNFLGRINLNPDHPQGKPKGWGRSWLPIDPKTRNVRDEYPYNTTVPGGEFFYHMHQVSVRYVPNYEQSGSNPNTGAVGQGTKLNSFYNSAQVLALDPIMMWFGVSVDFWGPSKFINRQGNIETFPYN
jgi:RHS repeat-associated protein